MYNAVPHPAFAPFIREITSENHSVEQYQKMSRLITRGYLDNGHKNDLEIKAMYENVNQVIRPRHEANRTDMKMYAFSYTKDKFSMYHQPVAHTFLGPPTQDISVCRKSDVARIDCLEPSQSNKIAFI